MKYITYKILIAYEGQFDSTADVARFIAMELSKTNKVDIWKIDGYYDLQSYNWIIIGSAIQYDKWMPKARNFVLENQAYLSKVRVDYFFTCLTLARNNEKSVKQASGYANKLRELSDEINPTSIGQFAGVLDYTKMNFFTKILARIIFVFLRVREGDYRNWEEIKNWTSNLHSSRK